MVSTIIDIFDKLLIFIILLETYYHISQTEIVAWNLMETFWNFLIVHEVSSTKFRGKFRDSEKIGNFGTIPTTHQKRHLVIFGGVKSLISKIFTYILEMFFHHFTNSFSLQKRIFWDVFMYYKDHTSPIWRFLRENRTFFVMVKKVILAYLWGQKVNFDHFHITFGDIFPAIYK